MTPMQLGTQAELDILGLAETAGAAEAPIMEAISGSMSGSTDKT